MKVNFIKVPSGEITNYLILKKLQKVKNKIILSTGMANIKEIIESLNIIAKNNVFELLKNGNVNIKDIKLHKKLKEKVYEYFRRLKIKFLIYLEKLKIKQTKRDIQNLERLLKQEQKFSEKKERDREKFRLQLIKDIKLEERKKIYQLKDHLWKVGDRFAVIRQRYQEYRQKIREKQLEELEVRRKSREEARAILEAEKAENALKQKLVERLERFSRNMKSIVFQINKRYITKKRSPSRFIDNISESGECLIRNDDAPTDKDYLILLYVEGEDINQRLKNPICLDDKTDIGNAKNFQPRDIFEASDYIIDRLAVMFDKERKLKK